jgi:uncharacterized repeat protein (TIGR03809 family)
VRVLPETKPRDEPSPRLSMSATLPFHAFQEVAHRWRVLAERRCEHFLELDDSGRWRYYYSEQQFLDRLDEAIRLSERWAEIAPLATAEAGADQALELSDPVRRTAA